MHLYCIIVQFIYMSKVFLNWTKQPLIGLKLKLNSYYNRNFRDCFGRRSNEHLELNLYHFENPDSKNYREFLC